MMDYQMISYADALSPPRPGCEGPKLTVRATLHITSAI